MTAIREDQHGTVTGYVYGCRCDPCRGARREYDRERPDSVSPETVERVYAALEYEADMDGIATASSYRLGELTGVTHSVANSAIHLLAQQGRIKVVGRVGRGGTFEIHLTAA